MTRVKDVIIGSETYDRETKTWIEDADQGSEGYVITNECAITDLNLFKTKSLDHPDPDPLFVKRVEVVTNIVPEYIDGPKDCPTCLVAVLYPATTNYTTNLIIGTEAKDLFKAGAL